MSLGAFGSVGAFGSLGGTGPADSIGPPGSIGAPGEAGETGGADAGPPGAAVPPPVCTYFGSTAGCATTAVCLTPAGAVSNSQDGTSVCSPATNCVDSPNSAPRTSTGWPLPGTHGRTDGSVLSWPGTVGVASGGCGSCGS